MAVATMLFGVVLLIGATVQAALALALPTAIFCRGLNPAGPSSLPLGWCCSFGPQADGSLEEAPRLRARAFLAEL